MVSVARPWFICGYHGLIVTKCFLFFYLYKTMVNFRKRPEKVRPDDVINMIIKHIYQVELLYKVINMFIKTSFVITIISNLLTLMNSDSDL